MRLWPNLLEGRVFYETIEYIQTIPIFLIEEIISMIPDEWILTKEKKEMVDTLLDEENNLPKVIQQFINKIYQPFHSTPNMR